MFKDKIKEYRLKKNMTRQAVASKTNVSLITAIRWEKGKALPNSDALDLLCNLFEVNELELLNNEELAKVYNNTSTKAKASHLLISFVLTFMILLFIVMIISTIYNR